MTSNIPASIKARLMNIGDRDGRDLNRLLLLYAQERLLARLAASPHRERLVLKGGVLLYGRYGSSARPTRDLDLLGRDTSTEPEAVIQMLQEVVGVELADGLRFEASNMRAQRINEGADHEGVRVKLVAYLGGARVPLQVDVGFGDAAIPEPLEFRTLLELAGLPRPQVLAYSLEAVVAEKLEAMTVLGIANTRAKDFYDLYRASREDHPAADVLTRAVRQTFERRRTPLSSALVVLVPGFAADPGLGRVWSAWRRANPGLVVSDDLSTVLRAVCVFLVPVVRGTAVGVWQPETATWADRTVNRSGG